MSCRAPLFSTRRSTHLPLLVLHHNILLELDVWVEHKKDVVDVCVDLVAFQKASADHFDQRCFAETVDADRVIWQFLVVTKIKKLKKCVS